MVRFLGPVVALTLVLIAVVFAAARWRQRRRPAERATPRVGGTAEIPSAAATLPIKRTVEPDPADVRRLLENKLAKAGDWCVYVHLEEKVHLSIIRMGDDTAVFVYLGPTSCERHVFRLPDMVCLAAITENRATVQLSNTSLVGEPVEIGFPTLLAVKFLLRDNPCTEPDCRICNELRGLGRKIV